MDVYRSKGINLMYAFPAIIMIFTFTMLYAWIPLLKNIFFMFFGLLVGVITCKDYYSKPMMLAFWAYFIVLWVNRITGDRWISDNITLFQELFKLVLTGLMGYALLTARDDQVLKITVVLFILMLVINAIGTSIVETIVPGSIRTLEVMRNKGGDTASMLFFFRYGMANYALPSALVTIIPMLVLGIKMNSTNKKKRLLLVIGLVASLMLVYYSGAMMALLLALFGVFVSMLFRPDTNKRQLVSLFIIGILLFIIIANDNILLFFLDTLDRWVGYDSYFHYRIMDMEDLIVYGEATGDVEGRSGLYQITWNAILENPLLGVNRAIGNHSLLLDHLGYLGLVGFIPFIFFVIAQIRMFAKLIPSCTRLMYYVCIFLSFMMMAVKNMNGWETWLCLYTILPLLSKYCVEDSSVV